MNYKTLDEIAHLPDYKVLGVPKAAKAALRQASMKKWFELAISKRPVKGVGTGYVLEIDIEHPDFKNWWADYLKLPSTKSRLRKMAESQEKKAS